LYPIILVISLLGAFSINKNVFDVGVCVVFGVVGWLMNKFEFPLSPILLALILGPMCEQNFVRFMDLNGGNFMAITGHPIAIGFLVVAVGTVLFSIYNQQKINKREAEAKRAAKAAK
ncbi:MAG: tripartite tricarboxylate transporter permease, partial [Clostridia bacterium]|nr:tripartite tricarboxylate transporter permease [Clostridia bacterium]